ncbi:hypothetical protein J6590_067979 [Homalodisca vitripennis]|nr:hypothetical protein J6590_067979 [Homalodisca vitripennis]
MVLSVEGSLPPLCYEVIRSPQKIILGVRTTLHPSKESRSHHGQVKKERLLPECIQAAGCVKGTLMYLMEVICYARFHCETPQENGSTKT